ncbi:MAG TPA: M1 family metallopeptidase [Cyclobacteriaceae bacterium]|nr:M1 family metallopeptidase [Cyclobacteriaceae bacterium]
MRIMLATFALIFLSIPVGAQLGAQLKTHTRADTLRGTVTPEREWWDAVHYDLHVRFNNADSALKGYNVIHYKVQKAPRLMQIDLMKPMVMDSIVQDGSTLRYEQEGNAFFVHLLSSQEGNSIHSITFYYHGKPQAAVRPPWDGGLIWARDKKGRPWISIACQGLGASVWYPCKDHQGDEPDSASIHITTPDSLVVVANGRLKGKRVEANGEVTFHWTVVSPINNYNIIPYIGYYVNLSQPYAGLKGPLDVNYWVLDYNLPQAQTHLRHDVERTLKNLEYWFGPYPFYEDGYQIVDAPHLGMEHQSAIAYGNGYQNGYLGHDLSGTGWGLKWDFIVVHESAHEWFGNNITTKDLADMWVHESFANYAETLFTTSEYGKEAGNDYVIGTRKNIQNDVPIIGRYNVNEEGSGDMYYKGGNMLHMIRQIINEDEKFRQILRGLNTDFYHTTVTTTEIENYISKKSGIDFTKVFDQYLRTTQIPVLKYSVERQNGAPYLVYFWDKCVEGFDMAVRISLAPGKSIWLRPQTKIQRLKLKSGDLPATIVDRNFYVGEERKEQIGNP